MNLFRIVAFVSPIFLAGCDQNQGRLAAIEEQLRAQKEESNRATREITTRLAKIEAQSAEVSRTVAQLASAPARVERVASVPLIKPTQVAAEAVPAKAIMSYRPVAVTPAEPATVVSSPLPGPQTFDPAGSICGTESETAVPVQVPAIQVPVVVSQPPRGSAAPSPAPPPGPRVGAVPDPKELKKAGAKEEPPPRLREFKF